MSKQNNEDQSSRNALMVMAAGGIAVAALVGWALTRSVEPAVTLPPPDTTTAQAVTTAPPPVDTTGTFPPPVQAQPSSPEGSVPRMTVDELKEKLARGEVTVIDVRDIDSYNTYHIRGAMHIPFSRIEAEAPLIPRSKPIVTYCT